MTKIVELGKLPLQDHHIAQHYCLNCPQKQAKIQNTLKRDSNLGHKYESDSESVSTALLDHWSPKLFIILEKKDNICIIIMMIIFLIIITGLR